MEDGADNSDLLTSIPDDADYTNTVAFPKKVCRPAQKPEPKIFPYQKFLVENLTVARAPLLKCYYWQAFDIDGLNAKLVEDQDTLEHTVVIPTSQCNANPLKFVLWLRNYSTEDLELKLKRIQNCQCAPLQTRVGFNQFRDLFHCPHRRLIHILQEVTRMKPDDTVAIGILVYFFLYGEHHLTYEIKLSDKRTLRLHFMLDIIGFDSAKSILTTDLIPTSLLDHRRFVQPIWVRNISMEHLNFTFSTRSQGFKILNPTLTVPRQSVWPLMVQFRPTDYETELNLTLQYETIRTTFLIRAKGMEDPSIDVDPVIPRMDLECVDFPYVIYPNAIDFDAFPNQLRSKMVHIHNYSSKCMEFFWQKYIINDMFEIVFEPDVFRLKSHHSKLCVVYLKSFQRPLHFKAIPTVLEVHRILDKSTQIAQELLDEVESIDDPKWALGSYVGHVFLHVNIKVNFSKEEPPVVKIDQPEEHRIPAEKLTIFEKLFWEYLSQSDHRRRSAAKPANNQLSYKEVLRQQDKPIPETICHDYSKTEGPKILTEVIADALRDMAKNWRFVPLECGRH